VSLNSVSSIEKKILFERYGRRLWAMRMQPSHAAWWIAGVFMPPHERFWLGVYFGDTKENNVLASRGTSKSFTHASFGAPLKAMLFKNLAILCLSNSGFRGGKELFKDGERLVLGQLKSQEIPGAFMQASISAGRTIRKDPSIWAMEFRSNSRYATAPTNNPDQLRGLRANEVILDERAFMPDEIPQKIIRPMLVVGSDFRRTAAGSGKNKMYQVSTIDYSIRGWWAELQVAMRLQRDEHAAWEARKQGDWAEHDRLMKEHDGALKTASFSFTRFDYTDLLIPTMVATLDGEHRYKVTYPLDKGLIEEDVVKWDEQDGISFIYTYPVEKKQLEEGLRNGTIDEEIWLAEQRNVPISASGNVFDHDLIQKVAERPINVGDKVKRLADMEDDDEFFAPVLYSCGDPCVLGVDVARESDETAFVVIRLGELAEGEFAPFVPRKDDKGRPLFGLTTWNHVCWAESWKKLEAGAVAAKILDFFSRYNIIATLDVGGIGMDKRGGGSAVRDELGNPKPPLTEGKADPNWDAAKVMKLFDPEDTEGFAHYSAMNDSGQYWNGLRLLATTNQDNMDWTFGARGLMQQRKLYIAYFMPPSKWAAEKGLLTPSGEPDRANPEYRKWEIGFNGIRRLKSQLLRIQTKVSEQGTMRFVMPGNRSKEEGKKDLWAAMIYAVSLARAHLLAKTKDDNTAPMVEPLLVTFGPQAPNPFGWQPQGRMKQISIR
jgi:hypothetical protein